MEAGIALCSDNWWIEDSKAYYCPFDVGVLLCADMNMQSLEMVARIPKCKFRHYRKNAYCLKYEDIIFCIPYDGKEICYYDVKELEWGVFEAEYQNRLILCPNSYEQVNEIIWLLEYQGRKIYQINLREKKVEKKYTLSQNMHIFTGNYVCVKNKLYCVAGKCIYVIDTKKDCNICQYELAEIEGELYTICYDGDDFWLSGEGKEIYIWNPTQGIVKKIADFLDKFDVYYLKNNVIKDHIPMFTYSVFLGTNIWYIPLQGNVPIIYIDKTDYKINIFNILEEMETEESLLERGKAFKYSVLYIRSNRYIGLYSCKNQIVWEIDAYELCVKKKEYCFSNVAVHALAKARGTLLEGCKMDEEIYYFLLKENEKKTPDSQGGVGRKIFNNV